MTLRSRLVTRYLAALRDLTRGSANPWRRADDVARYGGVPIGKLNEVLAAAVEGGLIDRHADDPEMVKLTAAGSAPARGEKV